jgi:hypothetical protein
MRFAACPTGSCTTPDIAIDVSTTDVRCGLQSTACGKSNMAGKRDYGGELEGRATVRITDAASGTGEGEAATMTDYALKIPISCAPTASRGEGSICAVSTTVNTLVSGAVRNGDRALWEVGQLQVLDGGPDGARVTAPNQLFLVQGLFLP